MGSDGIGKTRFRYGLSVQEEPPNHWYVCVLCGGRFEPQRVKKHYCIVVVVEDDHGVETDRFHIPVHTDCVMNEVGDRDVRAKVRRYSGEIRRRLERVRRNRIKRDDHDPT